MTARRVPGVPAPATSAVASAPPTTAVADVLALRGRTGWLSPPLRPIVVGGAAEAQWGVARTVRLGYGRGGLGPLYGLLSGDLSGLVLVLMAPDDKAAVWGELLSTAAAQVGATAVLVAGAVRDVGDCEAVGLPLWARATHTAGPAGGLEVAAIGEPLTIGSLTVADGALVVLDADGVVALPVDSHDPVASEDAAHSYEDATAVLADARTYAAAEDQVGAALRAGVPLREAYRFKADVVARLTASQPSR